MDMKGEHRIPAPRETVWEALNDPDVLKASIPGCETLERNEAGDGFDAKVKAKVGPVKATFSGSVSLENVNAPESYTIVGEGKGGAAGFAKGSADVHLAEDGGETVLSYEVKAHVGGKLAQLGARLIDSTAKKYANDFFGRFAEIVSERAGGAPEKPTAEAVQQAAEAAAPSAAAGAPPPEPAAEPAAEPAPAPHEAGSAAASPSTGSAAEIDDGMKEAEPSPTRAALDAVDQTRGARKGGLSGMSWTLIVIIVVLLLLAMFSGMGGDGGG
eukprot:g827.t1